MAGDEAGVGRRCSTREQTDGGCELVAVEGSAVVDERGCEMTAMGPDHCAQYPENGVIAWQDEGYQLYASGRAGSRHRSRFSTPS
jgi:hypothetical protein